LFLYISNVNYKYCLRFFQLQ